MCGNKIFPLSLRFLPAPQKGVPFYPLFGKYPILPDLITVLNTMQVSARCVKENSKLKLMDCISIQYQV